MAKAGDTTNGDRIMYVRFQRGDDEEFRDALRSLDRGELSEPHFEVVFDDSDDIHRVTRPKNLELLRAIVQHDPDSIRETARLVDRDVRQVHTNLEELEALHLIEFEQNGNRKRPRVWYDAIEVDLPLNVPDTARDETNA